MKILFVTSECAPYSKSGGLADVAFSLPPALNEAGNEVAVITPLYKCVKDKYMDELTFVRNLDVYLGENAYYCGLFRGERAGTTIWFVDNESFFDRPKLYGYDDDKLRFAYFCRAVIEVMMDLDFKPEIIHCNDWETALAVIYLENDKVYRPELRNIKSVYTIHNIAYQGQFGANELYDTFALPEGWYNGGLGYEYEGRHDINLMKGAMLMADAVSTVSPTYAKELHSPVYGMGLQGVADIVEPKLYGILNGIDMDHYDPSKDTRIPFNFSVDDMSGKAKCKESIQKKFGLTVHPRWPLLASVARLTEQKGIELIKMVLPGLMDMGIQLIVFGQGDQEYIDYFNWAKTKWPEQLGFSSDYTEQMASEIFAGADMYLMPSRFEPCGLSQMMAMRNGTVPIVHSTGGLKDSVRPYKDFDGIGDGFAFSAYDATALYLAIREAVKVYFGEENVFDTLRYRGMTKDFSWTKSAQAYNRMYGEICDGGDGEDISFFDAFMQLNEAYKVLTAKNRKKHPEYYPEDYHRYVQFEITGRGHGIFSIEFTHDGMAAAPVSNRDAEVFLTSSFDNYLGMATGKYSADSLFMNGKLKVSGNISKGAELRLLLSTED